MPTSGQQPSAATRQVAFLLLAGTIAIGTVSFTFVKIALRELSAVGLATGRVVSSATLFLLVMAFSRHRYRRIERPDRARVILCGFFGSAGFHILFVWGQQRVSVAIAAVVMATMPMLVAVGEVTVSTRGIAHLYDAWWLNTPGTLLGAVVVLAIEAPNVAEFGSLSLKGWLLVIWLGTASSAFIYFAITRAMTTLSATTAISLGTIVTPSSMLVAWLLLGDAPGVLEVIAAAVVVVGVVLVTAEPRKLPLPDLGSS